jgi:phosphoribosylamine--glycine ligase
MRVAFVSGWGSAVPLAMEIENAGHETRFWIQDKGSEDVGDGFIEKAKDWKELLGWCDYVICDDVRMSNITDSFREKGIPVIGGTKQTDALEDNRHLGQRLMKSIGLNTPESREFKTLEEAIAYVQENPKKYVVKLSGKAQDNKMTTYVGQDEGGADIIPVLEHMAKGMSKGLEAVELQEMVEGMEVAVSAFFNGERFIGPCQLNFEHKKLMPGPSAAGWGPNTGEMGTTGLWCDREIGLFKKLLLPMEKPLKGMGYHGDFDINAILAEDGKLFVLEQTNRFGWPALPMQLETMKENDLGDFFYALAAGKDFDLQTTFPYSLCLVVGVPPLPYTNDEIFEKYSKGVPVVFRDGSIPEGLYPGEAKLEDEQWKVAGSKGMSGCLAVAAAGGYSIEECSKLAYAITEQVIVPNKMVRNDIGIYTEESAQKLSRLKLVTLPETSNP